MALSNLEKAQRALKGTKKYRVSFTERNYYSGEVEAANADEAEEIARKELDDGNWDSNNGETDCDGVEEIK